MKTLQLQGIGKRAATEAKNIKIGDTLIWNYGMTEKVIDIKFSKTGKTLTTIILTESGKQYERRLGAERLVVIA